jgi:hypothetical protein
LPATALAAYILSCSKSKPHAPLPELRTRRPHPLALRLKSDLERRNHEVWFDQSRLTPGADWERQIDDSLDQISVTHGKFLMLLTPHSVRRPNGYCLNELARACARQLPIIPLMVSTVEPPLSICRIQYLDFRDCVPADQHEPRYAAQIRQAAGRDRARPPGFRRRAGAPPALSAAH